MRALLSGQAGLALIVDDVPQIRSLDGAPRPVLDVNDAFRVFDGCSDVHQIDVAGLEEVDQRLETEWAADRAVRILLLILDRTASATDAAIQDDAACIEDLMKISGFDEILHKRILAYPPLVRIQAARLDQLKKFVP